MARELEIGRWTMRFTLYGDEAVVDHRFAKVKAALEGSPGSRYWGRSTHRRTCRHARASVRPRAGRRSEPRDQPDDGWYGGEEGGHIGFSPVVRLTGQDAMAVRDCSAALSSGRRARLRGGSDPDELAQLHPCDDGHLRHQRRGETRRAYDTSKLLVQEAAKAGYGEYRAHLDFMDLPRSSTASATTLPALRRDDQGRGRPERHLLAGQAGLWPASMCVAEIKRRCQTSVWLRLHSVLSGGGRRRPGSSPAASSRPCRPARRARARAALTRKSACET